MFQRLDAVFAVFFVLGICGAQITLTPSSVTLIGSAEVNVTLNCKGSNITEIRVTRGEKHALIATSQASVGKGLPEIEPQFLERSVTGHADYDTDPQTLHLHFPRVTCEDADVYECTVTDNSNAKRTYTTSLEITDELQKAEVTVWPERSVSEGQKMTMTCQQIYGPIHPLDPRTKPRQIFWHWEYGLNDTGWFKLSGALSVFQDIAAPTRCRGIKHQSILTLYPIQGKHENAEFRCYLVINMEPVNYSLYGVHWMGSIGPPPPEKPVPKRYEYTTISLLAFLLGLSGFLDSLLAIAIFALHKKYRFCGPKAAVVEKELQEEEEELAQLEAQFDAALKADLQLRTVGEMSCDNRPSPKQDRSEEEPSMMSDFTDVSKEEISVAESSVSESSILESSFAESSVVESSVADSSASGE